MTGPEQGWLLDPDDDNWMRYWDGRAWTDERRLSRERDRLKDGEGSFHLITVPGADELTVLGLVVDRHTGLYERWCGDDFGWVDMPYYAAYFRGHMQGLVEIDPLDVKLWKRSVPVPDAGVVERMRGAP